MAKQILQPVTEQAKDEVMQRSAPLSLAHLLQCHLYNLIDDRKLVSIDVLAAFFSTLARASPLQLVCVVREQTLPHQAGPEQRHQVTVESGVILQETRCYSVLCWLGLMCAGWTAAGSPRWAPACGRCR